ncbi:hypothetical protein Fmac_002387 [Flemingia macrophylla]|uniref:Protein kinase domain-containing protein n=1 Tax=Flemingia macrophylla TaxID=520843 RepID=A0ABD1NJS8_9FABA
MNWIRGDSLGSGSFATVNKVMNINASNLFPSPAAVKSTDVQTSASLKHEKEVLDRIGPFPHVIRCYGHDHTVEKGDHFYNVFLEHAGGGSLADKLRSSGGTLPEIYVRRCTRSVLEALRHIHAKGFVHCDVKLQNILVFDDGGVKVADFGLAKQRGEKVGKWECRGTPLFMSPETVNDNEYESPADIWALGCAVVEMVTGKPAWEVPSGSNIWALLIRIGVGEESPNIPQQLSEEGRDFLRKCFFKDPNTRWSAEMLLEHPFVKDHHVSFQKVDGSLPLPLPSPSPRTHFDFPDWASTVTASAPSSPDSGDWSHWEYELSSSSPATRLSRLLAGQPPADWSESAGWISVRTVR